VIKASLKNIKPTQNTLTKMKISNYHVTSHLKDTIIQHFNCLQKRFFIFGIIIISAISTHNVKFHKFFVRCALAVKQEWRSAEDCIKFWSTDYKDNSTDKMTLMQQLVEISSSPLANASATVR
jgi:hypothetical protein